MAIRSPKERAPAHKTLASEPKPTPQPEEERIPLKVTALVVSCNRVERLRATLAALERSEARETMEIVVVDNGSTDGSAQLEDEFPNTRFSRLPKNFGLTKALNIGIRASQGEFIFLLHEDTEVPPNAMRELAAVLEARSDAGAVCPLLVDPEGRPAPQAGELPPAGAWRPVEASEEPVAVPYASGAAIMLRSLFLKGMGQIDEHYGQFGSDAEIAFQVRWAGKKILVLPGIRAVHRGGRPEDAMLLADFRIGAAVWSGKHLGVFAGLFARIRDVFAALAGFRFGELKYLLSGQKIDGNQVP